MLALDLLNNIDQVVKILKESARSSILNWVYMLRKRESLFILSLSKVPNATSTPFLPFARPLMVKLRELMLQIFKRTLELS